MKRLFFICSAIFLCSSIMVSAKKLPSKATQLPDQLKKEIMKAVDYPQFAEDIHIEGDVWLKVSVSDDSKVKIIDLSATNPALGKYVNNQLTDLQIKNRIENLESEYYLKIKFDILDD